MLSGDIYVQIFDKGMNSKCLLIRIGKWAFTDASLCRFAFNTSFIPYYKYEFSVYLIPIVSSDFIEMI